MNSNVWSLKNICELGTLSKRKNRVKNIFSENLWRYCNAFLIKNKNKKLKLKVQILNL